MVSDQSQIIEDPISVPKITFAELINYKPSNALKAMLEGLSEQSARPEVIINMMFFGAVQDGLCFMCAATCAIQKLAQVNYPAEELGDFQDRAGFLETKGFNPDDLGDFEVAMDSARRGALNELFHYCKLDCPAQFRDTGIYLTARSWLEQIPAVEQIIKELQELGL